MAGRWMTPPLTIPMPAPLPFLSAQTGRRLSWATTLTVFKHYSGQAGGVAAQFNVPANGNWNFSSNNTIYGVSGSGSIANGSFSGTLNFTNGDTVQLNGSQQSPLGSFQNAAGFYSGTFSGNFGGQPISGPLIGVLSANGQITFSVFFNGALNDGARPVWFQQPIYNHEPHQWDGGIRHAHQCDAQDWGNCSANQYGSGNIHHEPLELCFWGGDDQPARRHDHRALQPDADGLWRPDELYLGNHFGRIAGGFEPVKQRRDFRNADHRRNHQLHRAGDECVERHGNAGIVTGDLSVFKFPDLDDFARSREQHLHRDRSRCRCPA